MRKFYVWNEFYVVLWDHKFSLEQGRGVGEEKGRRAGWDHRSYTVQSILL